MISSKDRQVSPRQEQHSAKVKSDYSKPRLERLGLIREIARMPGGSINTEGNSGRAHRQ